MRLPLFIAAVLAASPALAELVVEGAQPYVQQDAPPALINAADRLTATRPHDAHISRLPADQQPSPMAAIGVALRALQPKVGETFYDLGCGPDARACIVAARDCGLNAVGIEIDPDAAAKARRIVAANGLADKITIITGDAANVAIPAGAIGYAYQFPDTLAKLAPQIRRFSRFATYMHTVPNLPMRHVGGDVYLYQQPQPPQLVRVAVPRSTASYGGRQYSGPVCSNPRCSMCAAIRSQLATPQYRYEWRQPATPTTQQPQQPAAEQPRGRCVTQKICHGRGRPCEYRRVWVPN